MPARRENLPIDSRSVVFDWSIPRACNSRPVESQVLARFEGRSPVPPNGSSPKCNWMDSQRVRGTAQLTLWSDTRSRVSEVAEGACRRTSALELVQQFLADAHH